MLRLTDYYLSHVLQNIGTKRLQEDSDSERGPNKNIRTVPQMAKVLEKNNKLNNEVDNLKSELHVQAQALTEIDDLKAQLAGYHEAETETQARLKAAAEEILAKQNEIQRHVGSLTQFNQQRATDISTQEGEIEALRTELARQTEQLTGHAEVVTEFNRKHFQEVSELHDTVSSLQQEKLTLQQEASGLRKQTQAQPSKLAELIAKHSSETTSLKRQLQDKEECLINLEKKSTSEAQRFMQLEADLKHEVNELHNQLDVSEEARATAENNAKQYQSGGPEFERSVNSEVERRLESDEFFQQRVQSAHVGMDEDKYYSRFIDDAKSLADMIHAKHDQAEAEYRKEFQDQIDAVKAYYATESEDKIHDIQTKYEVETKAKEEARKSATASEQKRIAAEDKVKNLELKVRQLECDVASRAREVPAGPSLPTAAWLADPSAFQKYVDNAMEEKLAQRFRDKNRDVKLVCPITDNQGDKMQVDKRPSPAENEKVPHARPKDTPGISSETKFEGHQGPPSAAQCENSGSHGDSGFNNNVDAGETNATPSSTGAVLDNTIPPAFWRLERLHSNMAVLRTQCPKWFSPGLTSYPSPVIFKNIKALQPVFSAHITKLDVLYGYEKSNAVNSFLVFLNQLLHEQVQPLIELAMSISVSSASSPTLEKCFDDIFVVGPGGVGILISFLMELFNMFRALPKDIPLDDSGTSAQRFFHELPSHLCVLLIHLRTKHHRSLWDADSCRDLIYILHNHGNKLPIGTPQSNLYTCFSKIDIGEDPLKISHITFLLANTFGNLSEPKNMCYDAICTGQYGLDGFYSSVVVPVLDDIDCDVDGYHDLLTVLAKLCKGLAHKASNVVKSYKQPSQERQDTSKDDEMNGTGNSHRQTRSSTWKKGPDPSARGATLNSKKRQTAGSQPFTASTGWPKKPFSSSPKVTSKNAAPKPGSSSIPGSSTTRASKVPKSRVQEAQELANTHENPDFKWPHFLSGLLNDFGHPDPNRNPRLTDIFKEGIQPTAQWKKMNLVYHIDKNRMQSEEWQEICSILIPALNLWWERIEGMASLGTVATSMSASVNAWIGLILSRGGHFEMHSGKNFADP
ncbi:hypothetical protein EDD85DRAFT_960114 [Armillaria nabsnona]|nr:hypothetical protein EDD85DRAFT_960114 [Armillaria nabsnona]